jgi:hypothetical protein
MMTDADIQTLLKKFAGPLAEYAAASQARKENADFMVRTLWTAMIAGPEMEEETWTAFREIAHLPEDDLKAIQDCSAPHFPHIWGTILLIFLGASW